MGVSAVKKPAWVRAGLCSMRTATDSSVCQAGIYLCAHACSKYPESGTLPALPIPRMAGPAQVAITPPRQASACMRACVRAERAMEAVKVDT